MKNKKSKSIASEERNDELKKNEIDNQEPSWYHYFLVLFVLLLIVGIFYFGYYYFLDENSNVDLENKTFLYKVPYKIGNVTYNLHFENDVDALKNMNYIIEPTELDLLNTVRFKFSFLEYNGSDNGQVSKGSTKLVSFLKAVYKFKFSEESFVRFNQTNCMNSTLREKVIVFNPYLNKSGVFYNRSNGCIVFGVDDPVEMIDLTDKFIYEMTLGKNG